MLLKIMFTTIPQYLKTFSSCFVFIESITKIHNFSMTNVECTFLFSLYYSLVQKTEQK